MKYLIGVLAVFCCASQMYSAWLVDNAETGTTANTRGGPWVTFNDGYSTMSFTPNASPGYSGNYCRSFDWTINTGASSPYAGAITSLSGTWTGVDLHTFYGVRFYARGTGRYDISLATDQTRSGNNHYVKSINLTPEWALYELPFSQFAQTWGDAQSWDPTTIYGFGIAPYATYGMSGEIRIDDIEFYLESEQHPPADPNQIVKRPKTNQVGYLPDGQKYFCIVANSVAAGDTFHIVDSLGRRAYSGVISGLPRDDSESTGENVWKTDFSGFQTPGRYRIEVNDSVSYPFTISDSVYNSLMRDALRCFYLIRCGLAENDPVSGINRLACHLADAKVRGGTGAIDARGGWHNAGDKGKFLNETAISIASMLWLYELKSASVAEANTNTPESANGIPDILDEAKWGLEWLLKLQKADGTVYHKVDAEPNLFDCPDKPFESDPYTDLRYVEFQRYDLPQAPSTIDAADFVGVMSQAARVFRGIDSAFATRCLAAANKTWNWVRLNKGIGQSDPAYIDSVATQEYIWAEGEMARTLGNSGLRSQYSGDIDLVALTPAGWGEPQIFGALAMYYDNLAEATLKDKIRSKVVDLCNAIVDASESSGYGVALRGWEYWWESNEWVMSKANCLLVGYEMTAQAKYKNAALSQLNYILGLNSLNKSFVMGYGGNSMEHPFNCVYTAYLKPIPGWTAGGANSKMNGVDAFLADLIRAGTPPAKCYVDRAECGLGSWASNEGETSENAALVFLSGYFYKGNQTTSLGTDPDLTAGPGQYDLRQNYPNPFNPTTKLRYSVGRVVAPSGASPRGVEGPAVHRVRLVVYDLLGRRVATLVDEERAPGSYEVNFDGSGMASGVYIYRLTAGGFVQSRKMLLVR